MRTRQYDRQKARVMRDLALIAIIFALAVLAGMATTPLMSIVFVLVARFVLGTWYETRQAYRQEMAQPREKSKRKHILTADGERLEIAVAGENDEQRFDSTYR